MRCVPRLILVVLTGAMGCRSDSIAWPVRAASELPIPRTGQAPPPSPVRKSKPKTQTAISLHDLDARFRRHLANLPAADALEALRREPRFLPRPSFAANRARYYRRFVRLMKLNRAARRGLVKRGFAVVPPPRREDGRTGLDVGEGPANLYYRIFAAKLPVFISADSILYAWHRTFDEALKELETEHMRRLMKRWLAKTMAALDQKSPAGRDAWRYLAVARYMLDPYRTPDPVAARIKHFKRLIRRGGRARIEALGTKREIDFRRFRPPAHYRSLLLRRYFRAYTWLAEVALLLDPLRSGLAPRPREEAAARAIAAASLQSGGYTAYLRFQRTQRVMVGRSDAVGVERLLSLCAQVGRPNCRGDAKAFRPAYGARRPRVYTSNHRLAEALAFHALPRAFSYDAWITMRTTDPDNRPMASIYDVAYALGNRRAARYLGRRVAPGLARRLEALRTTVAELPPERQGSSVRHHWLGALHALARTDLRGKLPQVLRTGAWQERRIEAFMGSWTEMRQDLALMVEPSLVAEGCQYPDGYVEPVPALYRALRRAADRLFSLLPSNRFRKARLAHWRTTLARLERMARLELAGKPFSPEDRRFLRETVDRHASTPYDRVPRYDGWYPRLFPAGKYELLRPKGRRRLTNSGGSLPGLSVATLHTAATRNPREGRLLQSTVGPPSYLVVALDFDGKTTLYGGPVYTNFTFNRSAAKPLTQKAWRYQVATRRFPPRPPHTRSYRP